MSKINSLTPETRDHLFDFAARLAAMPTADENMPSTWCPPDYDDLKTWWTDTVLGARKLTGTSPK